MNSAIIGISNNLSESLDDVLQAAGGKSSVLDNSGIAGPSVESSGGSYSGLGIETAGAAASFMRVEMDSAAADAAADITSSAPAAASADAASGGGAGLFVDAAPGPAVSLSTLANYLTSGYWTDTGRTSRWYNVDDNGTGANFGRLEYNISGWSGDANGISAARQTLVREAFKIYEEVLGIDFVEVGFDDGLVDFFFKDNDSGAYNSSTVHAGTGGAIDFSVINVNSGWNGGTSVIGDYTFQTILHEIGHALGLGHQGNYNGSGGFGVDALYDNDSWALSMMSYFDQVENTSSSTNNYDYARLIGPMSVDWLALNNLYDGQDYAGNSFGVNQSFTGNTTWGFNTNITAGQSAAYNAIASLADTNAFTIVDGGGIDTVDFSGFAADQKINLLPASSGSTIGSVSNIGGLIGNMTLAVGTIIENAIGGSGDDDITGNDVGNVLTGNGGDDTLKGMGGGDVLYGGAGNDLLYGDDGAGSADLADSIYGGSGDDEIHMGAGGGDFAYGGADNDTVFWGPPTPTTARTVDGGTGIDTISGGGTEFGAGATFNLGADQYTTGFFTETWANFENYYNVGATGNETVIGSSGDNLIQFGSGNNEGYGGGGVDTIYGGGGNDILEGGFVTDNVYGGDGNDTLRVLAGEFYDNSYGGAGADTLDHSASAYGGSTFDFELGTITGPSINGASAALEGIETYLDGSGSNTIISSGTSGTYYGGGGNDLMIAEAGGEFMYGGAGGVDTIDLSRWNGTYIVNMNDGSSNYGSELYLEFENLISGNGSDTITGTGGDNTISTGGGADTVNAGDGADTVNGDAGNDILNGGAGIDNLYGGANNDTLNGGSFEDNSYGGTGDDTFRVTGADFGDNVYGGADNDVLDLSGWTNAAIAFNVNLQLQTYEFLPNGFGVNGVYDLQGVENVRGSNFNDTITGDGLANILVGGGGQDTMSGGNGDDSFYVDNVNDSVTENIGAGTGFDTIFASTSFTSFANVERMYLTGAANINGTGVNGQNDIMYGNGGNNILDGLTGTDNMNGGLGDDQYYVNTSGDVINEAAGAGFDTMFSQSSNTIALNVERLFLLNGGNYNANGRDGQNDFISGNDGANIINGFSGNDTIRGGLGNDTLTGGLGLDIFQFLTAPNTATNRDFITDFTAADDTIQIDNLFYAAAGAAGFLAAALFKNLNLGAQDADDAILYDQANGNLYYDGNGLAAGGVVQFAEFANGTFMDALDFVVV